MKTEREMDISRAKQMLNDRFGTGKTATDADKPYSWYTSLVFHPVRDANGNLEGFGIGVKEGS